MGKKEEDDLMAFIARCFKNMLMGGACRSPKQGIWVTHTLDLEGNPGLGSKRCMRSGVR